MSAEKELLVIKELAGHPPVTLTPLQEFLLPYVDFITLFWWAVWGVVSAILLWQLFRAQREPL